MDLAGAILRLFGFATQIQERARGLALLLALPAIVVGVADWRVRRRR
jgi:hypothetical protein